MTDPKAFFFVVILLNPFFCNKLFILFSVKKEFLIKVKIALVKNFNIKPLKLDFTKYLKSSRVYDQSLYFIPTKSKNLRYYNGYWIWKEPKRFGQVSHNFKEIFENYEFGTFFSKFADFDFW